jgi:hypothetical protein
MLFIFFVCSFLLISLAVFCTVTYTLLKIAKRKFITSGCNFITNIVLQLWQKSANSAPRIQASPAISQLTGVAHLKPVRSPFKILEYEKTIIQYL